MRKKLRTDKLLPRCKKSRTDKDEPKRVMEKKLKRLPSRPHVLKLNVLPRCTKSSTENPEPKRP
jgi:hypothetical protein